VANEGVAAGVHPANTVNPVRARWPYVAGGAAVFVALLVIAAVTQSNAWGTAVAVYGIVAGVLLGRLLARGERSRAPAPR